MRVAPSLIAVAVVACNACNSDTPAEQNPTSDRARDAGANMQTPPDAGVVDDPTALVSIRATWSGPATLAPGATSSAIATGVKGDGSEVDLTNAATWSSDAPQIAEALAGGAIRAITEGTANIRAT